jgi:APA family basic amino acid/polyamine antiporter
MNGGTIATLAVAFSNTLNQIVPLSAVMSKVVALAMIAVMTIVNVIGTRTSADLQNWTTGIKVAALLLMSVALLALGSGFSQTRGEFWPAEISGSLLSGCGLAMIGVLWAYEGWQYVTFSAGEVVEPQRNYPRAFWVGTAALIFIYLLANVAYVAALGPAGLAKSPSAAAESLTQVINPTAAKLIAMANDGLFFKKLAEVHPRFKTPAFAIIAGSAWGGVLALSGTFNELLTYVVFGGWMFYGLAAATIFVYRKRLLDCSRHHCAWIARLFDLESSRARRRENNDKGRESGSLLNFFTSSLDET